jgi:hypothetical protein
MPTFELSKEDCDTLVFCLNQYDLTKAEGRVGSTSFADNSAWLKVLEHLQSALGVAVTNTFDATVVLDILNKAERGVFEDKPDQRPSVRRLLERGYLVGSGPDHHGNMRVSHLHETGRPLRDFLEWWKSRP